MRRDLTIGPRGDHSGATKTGRARAAVLASAPALLAALIGVLLAALAYQVPATHAVDVGGYDAPYLRGFHDPERASAPGARAYLDGSDGSARWTRGESFLLFPQAGLPAQLILQLRGRPSQAEPVMVAVLVNGRLADRFPVGPAWQSRTLAVSGGLLKPEDVVIAIQADTAALGDGDQRQAGVLIDRAIYTVGPPPILPYPAQMIYVALAAGLLAMLLRGWQPAAAPASPAPEGAAQPSPANRATLAAGVVLICACLLLYRIQLPYPLLLRGLLPAICAGLGALLAIRHAAALAGLRRAPDALAVVGIAAWAGGLLLAGRDHLVQSVPGVEKDFRVFATRDSLATIFHADGFYNLGYPLLLWLARPLAENSSFLAGRLVAALSGAVLLAATWRLARMLLGPGPALVALATLALSPLVVQYGLYLGSDMPFAALCALSLVGLGRWAAGEDPATAKPEQRALTRQWPLIAAGLAAGCAFLVRHPGLVLLPLGWLAIVLAGWADRRPGQPAPRGPRPAALAAYTLAFALAIAPQLAVNLRDTGQLFYSQQAKNVWLAVFGGGDWGRWGEAADSVTLGEVLLQDPGRFLANFAANLLAYAGSGAEDSSEFGRAIQLRLLSFPANWLAVAGLLGWLWALGVRRKQRSEPAIGLRLPSLLLAWIALYVPAIAVAFALPRFFLPLAPAYAIAAGWMLARLAARREGPRAHLALGLLLTALLWGGFDAGTAQVLRPVEVGSAAPGQPDEVLAAARLVLAALGPGERVLIRVPLDDEAGLGLAKYSAIAHLAAPAPAGDDLAALRATGAGYLLWSDRLGQAPVPGPELGRAGSYALYRLAGQP